MRRPIRNRACGRKTSNAFLVREMITREVAQACPTGVEFAQSRDRDVPKFRKATRGAHGHGGPCNPYFFMIRTGRSEHLGRVLVHFQNAHEREELPCISA
jgi:hypothetical protein